MNLRAIRWAREDERVQAEVRGQHRAVLATLAAYDGNLSDVELAERSGYSRDAVRRSLDWLEAHGWLARLRAVVEAGS